MNEFDLIREIKKTFPHDSESRIGNDGFPFKISSGATGLISKDLLVEGVHFYPEIPLDALAYKALTVNLTDILSDGGKPLFFIIGVGAPSGKSGRILELYQHFAHYCRQWNVPIRGGDTVASPTFFLSVTCVGETSRTPWLRKNARIGDGLYVTGTLGGSAEGFSRIQTSGHDCSDPLIRRHLYPPFRNALSNLPGDEIHAALDLSDGLLPDLAKMLEESNAGACLDESRIPVQEGASLAQALFGGEDYEILFTASRFPDSEFSFPELGFPITRIGTLTPEKGIVTLKKTDGTQIRYLTPDLIRGGFDHWKT